MAADREQPKARGAKPPPPYFAAPYSAFHTTCLRAMADGTASPEQAKAGLEWIVNVACATYQQPFIPGEPDASAFFAGRIFAGQQIVKLTKINERALEKAKPTPAQK